MTVRGAAVLRRAASFLRPSAYPWDWVWDWVTQGSPKGHARATQASRKRDPRVDRDMNPCFQRKLGKGRVGEKIADIARDRRDRKGALAGYERPLILTSYSLSTRASDSGA